MTITNFEKISACYYHGLYDKKMCEEIYDCLVSSQKQMTASEIVIQLYTLGYMVSTAFVTARLRQLMKLGLVERMEKPTGKTITITPKSSPCIEIRRVEVFDKNGKSYGFQEIKTCENEPFEIETKKILFQAKAVS